MLRPVDRKFSAIITAPPCQPCLWRSKRVLSSPPSGRSCFHPVCCLFVCLLTELYKNYSADYHKISGKVVHDTALLCTFSLWLFIVNSTVQP